MAKCDEGYRCDVCGNDVTSIIDSDLYLRYVIGEISADVLHQSPERHLRCNPVLAQFIDDDRFDPPQLEGDLDRRRLDADFARQRTDLVSRGYRRLQEINAWQGDREILQYPLPGLPVAQSKR